MNLDLSYILIILGVILLSMTLHEAMHAFVSNWLGDDTARREGRLTLNPVAHIDPYLTIAMPLLLVITSVVTQTSLPIFGGAKPVPFNPNRVKYGDFGAALVGVSGPLLNLLLAFIAFAVYVLAGQQTSGMGLFLQAAVMVNLGFFIFNMLPIPPLDGSRALYAVAPGPVRGFMETIERNGLFVVFIIVVLFSGSIGSFIVAAQNEIIKLFAALLGVKVL